MNILITGNLGYVGPVLVGYLNTKKNINVFGLDAGWFESETLNSTINENDKVKTQIYKDIRDLKLEDLKNIDAVVHLAAVSNDPMGKEFAVPTKQINLEASKNLVKNCHLAGIKKFIFASSCSVYGAGGEFPKKEIDGVMPITEYAVSKIEFENYLKQFSDETDIQFSCLRFSTAAGPSSRIRLDLVLNDFVISALTKKEINILSNGDPLRPIIDVEDMARSFYWSLNRKGKNFEIFNIGLNENNMTVLEIAETVKSIIPSTIITINKDAAPDKRSYRVNFDKFNNQLPPELALKYNVAAITKRLVAQLTNYTEILQDFRNSDFIRLNKLRKLKKTNLLDKQLRKL